MGLDKYVVNINENYINYIQSNPKLVQPMDNLAVGDTGTTGHYLNLDLPCGNKKQAFHQFSIQMPNGEIIMSMHTALLSRPELPLQAQRAHILTGINKALLYIGALCDHGCEAIFNDKYVSIMNKRSGKLSMKGTRDPHTNLYMLNLTQKNKLMTESTVNDVIADKNVVTKIMNNSNGLQRFELYGFAKPHCQTGYYPFTYGWCLGLC